MVKAEHEEKPDEHGHVYRHFNRRYVLPRNIDLDQVKATMSDDGTLVVCAPKKPLDTVTSLFCPFCFQSTRVFVILYVGK